MADERYKPTTFTAADVLEGAYRRAGTMPTADASALYDRVAAARAAGQHRLVANLSQQYADVLAREHARRNPVTPAAAPSLTARPHLDEVNRLRAEGKTRMVAALEERHAGVLAVERQARTAEIASWQAQQEAQRTAAEPPPDTTTETAPPPSKPRRHLDHLAHLRATGQTRAAMTFEETHGPVIEHERRQREAEQRGEAEPLTVNEILNAAPSTWASALEGKIR